MKLDTLLEEEYERINENKTKTVCAYNSHVSDLIDLFVGNLAEIDRLPKNGTDGQISKLYSMLVKSLSSFPIASLSPSDITEFSLASEELQDKKNFKFIGAFLSALINTHKKKTRFNGEYVLFTERIEKDITFLGYKNTANIKIIGNAGSFIAERMICGNVSIEGNVENGVGYFMTGGTVELFGNVKELAADVFYPKSKGTIIIHGNCGSVGDRMSGGTVIVHGDVHWNAGRYMSNGNIILHGKVADPVGDRMSGGKIYLSSQNNTISPYFISGTIYQNNEIVRHRDGFWKRILRGDFT